MCHYPITNVWSATILLRQPYHTLPHMGAGASLTLLCLVVAVGHSSASNGRGHWPFSPGHDSQN